MKQPIQTAWAALVVALAGALVALPALGNGFAYDDTAIIAADSRVHSFDIPAMLTSGYWASELHALYRPVTTLSFALDWSIAPNGPAWFHFTNLLLHAGASALVFALLVRYFSTGAALVGGLVFAVHPVHVEAVANVVGRAELLAAFFALATLLVWNPREPNPRFRAARTLGVGMLALLAVASKESAVVLPGLLILMDFTRGEMRDGIVSWLRRTAPGYTAVLLGLVTFVVVRTLVLGAVAPSQVEPVFEVATTHATRVMTALQAWPHYVRLLFYPRTLLADYGPRISMPILELNAVAIFGAVLLAAVVAGGVLAAATRRPRAAWVLLWFPLTILPVSNLLVPIGILVAERTLYLPSVALAAAAAALAMALGPATPAIRKAGVAAVSIVLVLFAARAIVRAPEWESTDRIIAALVRDRPDAFRGEWHMARIARVRGDTIDALTGYDRAMVLWPWRQRLVVEAATYAAGTGRIVRARELAGAAVSRWPDDIEAQRLLASTALDLGDTTAARRAMRAGLAIDPADDLLRRMSQVLTLIPDTVR